MAKDNNFAVIGIRTAAHRFVSLLPGVYQNAVVFIWQTVAVGLSWTLDAARSMAQWLGATRRLMATPEKVRSANRWRQIWALKMRRFLVPVAMIAAPVSSAEAVGFMTQLSCASDYYAYCSKHQVGSPGLRKCMNDNGPRLSNSCINALISDGEITKEEVARRREQVLAARRQKAEPQQAAIVADSGKADALKAKAAARVAEASKDPVAKANAQAVRTVALTLTLDQKTFEALKNRGNYFVVDGDDVVPSAFETKTAVATTDAAPDTGDSAGEVIAEAPPIVAAVPPVAAADALTPGPVKARPGDYPPGKMALGKKPSAEVSPPPPIVEEVLVPRKPSSAEIWMNYMQDRFNGGMNYEGVDANF